MDLQSWEKVLLEWVHNFGFTKTNYIALELTDIDAFFAYYVQKAQVEPVPVVEVALQAQPTHHPSPDEPFSEQLTPLQAFLREIYPEFNGHMDGQGRLAGSDYLYVYSLLLHYKCVKQPSASFHSICKKLPIVTQSSICEFFQQTMNRPLTRESLRQAIANVSRVVQTGGAAENKACRATSSLSLDSDGSGHCSSLGDDTLDLPIDFVGPMSSPSPKSMPPPATPKTELLEQRTREVRGLQAQLEAERYEKNVLEEQIMENEHLIKSLRKENKVKKMQLAKLKDSDENEEEDSVRKYVPNEFDHLKCSLLKEISQKEAILTETRDKLQDLRIENSELLSKVKTSSEQLVVCMDRIRDLEVRQEELSQALSAQSDQVISLERDKQELEKCLQVTRDELHNRREVLNSSADLLDLPMSMSPNTTPENLADSVIDKQLREKEHENLELKEELQKTRKALLDLLEDHGLAVSEEHSSQLWSTVCAVKEELTKSVRLSELRESQLQEKSQQLDRALAQFAKLLEKGREHSRELDEINAKYEQMLCDHLSSKQELQSQNDRLLQSLNLANEKSAEADEHLRQIKLQLAEKEEQMDQLGSELLELRDKNRTLESRTNSLITERNSGVFQLHQEQRRQEYVRKKYAQCRDQLVAQTSDMSQLSSHLDASDWVGTLRRIDELRQQHEALKLEHAQTQQDAQDLRERLQLQQDVQQSHDQQHAELQQELVRAHEQMEAIQQDHRQQVDQIQTDFKQKMESFLSRITALLNGGVFVKSEDSGQLSELKEFESMLASSLRQRSQEVATLQATADQLREQLGAAQRQHDSMLEQESRERASRMAQLMRLTHSLEASAAKVRASLDGKDAEIAAGQQQVAKMQEQLASDQTSSLMLKQLNDTINNLEQVNEKLIDDNSKLQNLHMNISASLSFVTAEAERLTNELSKSKASLAELGASDSLKATQLSASAKEQQQLQGQLVEMCAKKSELEERVEHLRSQKSELEERCQELERQLAEKESQVSRLDRQHEDELAVIGAKLKEAQFKVEQQRLAILTEREEISKYRTQLAELSKARDQGEEEMAKLRVLLSQGEGDNQGHLKTIQDLQGKAQQLAQQMEKLTREHSEELRRLQALLTDEQEVTAQLRTQLAGATELAEARARQQAELVASLQHEKALIEQLCAEAEEKRATAYECIAKLEKLRESQDHRARQDEEEMAKLRVLLSQGERNNQEHLKTIEDLQGKGQQLAQQMEQLTREHSEELRRLQALLTDQQEVTAQLRTQLAAATELAEAKARHQSQAELDQTELVTSLQQEKQLRAEAEEKSAAAYECINKLEKLRESQTHRERHDEEEMAKLRVLLSQGERDIQEHLKTIQDLQGKGQQLAQQMDKLKGQHSEDLRRLSEAELAQTELVASLQHEKAMMEQLRAKAEEKSAAAYERIGKLEKLREAQDQRARKLNDQLAEAEKLKVSLNLEIGGLNSDIEQRKRQMAEQANELSSAQNAVVELQCRLKSEVEGRNQARKELEKITSKLAEVQQELNSTRLLHETQHFELDEKTREIELERAQSADRVQLYQRRIESLEGQLAEVQAATQAQSQASTDLCTTYSKGECAATASDDELAQLRQENARSKLDCQILQAKYRETKDEIQRCEQKMKDQRLEMEGKLDKMKTKMRSLYTAEVTRMKEKHERDAATNKAELDALAAQNVKYEEHTRKLSTQIVRLNEKILEQKKQNAIISTKLSHLQMQPLSVTKTSAPAPLVTVSAGSSAPNDDWQPFKRPSAPSSNLAMEDEEGEVFNNTYLTDLKLGRVPDITAEELNYRNSLQPPHLKSTYAAQYDLSSQDEDLKDGPHSLDDSMCALLSSTGTGTRKKSIGTHYKRPGPPTPSKNGGRLSFGSSEPPREVLREFGDHNTSKTPARFKFLTTRFSVGSSGLPRDELPQRKRSSILTRLQRRRLQRQAAGVFCTSTPRKSRSYYDQQRLIGASDAVFSEEEEEKAADQQTTPHLSNGALLALTQGTTRRITHTPKRTARVPLYLNGNVLAKSRSEGLKVGISGERIRQRRKMCQERMARFDQDRPLDQVRLSDRLSYSGRPSQLLMGNTVVLDDGRGRRSIVGLTFKVDDSWQLQHQQFEADNVSKWTLDNEDSEVEDCRFEELCTQRRSTAPFYVQPAVAMDSLSVRCGTLFRTIRFGQRVATVVLGLSVAVALLSLLVDMVRARV